MSSIGDLQDYVLTTISPGHHNSMGIELGGSSGVLNAGAAAAWPASNLALFIPFKIGFPYLVNQVLWVNGTTVGTNHVDVGVFDSQGNKLVSTGSTLTAGVSVFQSVNVTDTILERGIYYMAMAMDGTTDTIQRTASPLLPLLRSWGMYAQSTAFPLPAAATFAVLANAYLPQFAITSSAVI